jgi:PEP-CTERM motif
VSAPGKDTCFAGRDESNPTSLTKNQMKNSSLKSFQFRMRPIAYIAALCLTGGNATAQTVSGKITVDGVVQGAPQTGSTVTDSIRQTDAVAFYTGDASTGVFNVRAAHSGTPGITKTELTYSNTVTNTLATAQNVSFSFFVYAGSINSLQGFATSGANFASVIDWSGAALWSTSLAITTGRFFPQDPPTATINNSASAADFVYSTSGSTSSVGSWGDYTKTLGLGILNPGESKTLTYSMSTTSYSEAPNYQGYGGAAGFAGDPISFDLSPLPAGVQTGVTLGAVTAVPEPSAYVMAVFGLAMIGVVTTRRRRHGIASALNTARS